VRDLRRPTSTRTALGPESREGRRNRRLRQFDRPEKRQSRTLRQANRLRRHWNRNPVVALKQLPRDRRSGKSRRPAIPECVGRILDSQRATLSNLDSSQKSATLRSGGGRPFDYAVGEKLWNSASAASEHPAFARELPRLSPKCQVCFRPVRFAAISRDSNASRPKETPRIVPYSASVG
jgi:hypothetical protein